MFRKLGALKQEGLIGKILVTGCLSQRYQQDILQEMPEVDGILGTGSYTQIVPAIDALLEDQVVSDFGSIDAPEQETGRILTTPEHYAFIKIAEGCDNRCSYCIIPYLRGKFRSRQMDDVLYEARLLAAGGVRELIVVAQDTSRYGTDLPGHKRLLPELLRQLCQIEALQWIRVHYVYPDEIDDEFIEVMATEPKIVKYLDIPIQHGSDAVLKRMGRRTNEQQLRDIVDKLRREIPDICLRTTLITGFPGESEEDHEAVMHFVDDLEFDRLGVFTYSPEEDTPAAMMADQIPEEIKEDRRAEIMELQQEIAYDKASDCIGQKLMVMIEGKVADENAYVGRSYKDAPNVDGYVFVNADRNLMTGDFVPVVITGSYEYDLIGEIDE